jgi:outer membrane protein assembly factor BamD
MKLTKFYSVFDLSLVFPAILLLMIFSGCGNFRETFNFTQIDEDGNEIVGTELNFPAKTLLSKGMEDYNVGKYFTAIEFFDDILNRYPFSPEATLAELKAADCNFHLERYQEALLLYEEFENRHPTNESMPYVMFQKAMCNYKQIDRIDRDTAGAIKSIELFRQLLKAYPNSPYTEEAETRITAATEFLANHEYFVVDYYVRTAKYDQAIVRLKYLLAMYPETTVAAKGEELLARIEAGNPPKSRIAAWFPKLGLSEWTFFGRNDAEDSAVDSE